MPTWPSTLPKPSFGGYALNPVEPALRTDMEMGAARSRTRTAARNDKVSVTWDFTDAQMAIFRAWFDNPAECAYGSAWFDISLAIGTAGLTSHTVRFAGIWKTTLLPGMNWSVTATLEVR